MPDLVSSSASFDDRASRSRADRICASSTTRPVSGGKVTAQTASPAQSSTTRTTRAWADLCAKKSALERVPVMLNHSQESWQGLSQPSTPFLLRAEKKT